MPKLRIPSTFNIIRHGKDYLRNEWHICRDGFADVLQNTFDVPAPLPRRRVLWKYDTFSRTFQVKTPLRITIVPHYWKRIPGSFESCREWLSDQLVNRFNQYSRYFAKVDDDFDIVQYITGAIRYCNYFDIVPFYVGFIDTDSPDHSLTDIFLSDGDYEISVLTSSLFWKDAVDKNIRVISIRDGEEVSPLPIILPLPRCDRATNRNSEKFTSYSWSGILCRPVRRMM